MDYPLKRSKRKTVAIIINSQGEVEVRAPLRLPLSTIEGFVCSRQEWIAKKRAEVCAQAADRAVFEPRIGMDFPLLGENVPIRAGRKAEFRDGVIFLREGQPVPPQLESLCRALAKEYLAQRVAHYAGRIGVLPTGLRITGATTRFGSCSGKNSLNFTWRLMMAEPSLVDYVVVHELCHIRQHNHSAQFWAEVEKILPDYRERRRRLRESGRLFMAPDWGSGD